MYDARMGRIHTELVPFYTRTRMSQSCPLRVLLKACTGSKLGSLHKVRRNSALLQVRLRARR